MKSKYDSPVKVLLMSLCVAIVFAGTAFTPNAVTLAVILKVVPKVSKKSPSTEWNKAGKGDPLTTGDRVQTEKNSLAIIKFMDASIVRLRELSELSIDGQSLDGKFTKSIRLFRGAFGFEFQKQKHDEQFRLTSPTSVASIRGTKGKLSGSEASDTLVITEGLVSFRNSVSNLEVEVGAGSIGVSNRDGSITSRKATAQELADANSLASGGTSNELKLEFKDPQGHKKELKLKYKQ